MTYFILFIIVSTSLIASWAISMNLFYYIACFALLFFSAIRFDVGVDYSSYLGLFEDIRIGVNANSLEPLNMLIIKINYLMYASSTLIFSIYSIITISSVAYFVKRFSNQKEISIFIFFTVGMFYFSTFNIIRQWASVSMMLLSLIYLYDKKYVRMAVFIILACLFHLSALILILIPFLGYRFRKIHVFLFLSVSIFLGELLLVIIEYLPYVHYLNETFRNDRGGSLLLFSCYILFLMFSLHYSGYFSVKVILNRREVILFNMNLLSMAVLLISFIIGIDFQTMMRANIYFAIQLIIIVPMILSKFSKDVQILLYFTFICLMTIVFSNTLINNGVFYKLVPYNTIFN